MELSCLFVNYNSWRLLADALASLEQHPPVDREARPIRYEVVVVDNASPTDDPRARAAVEAAIARLGGQLVLHAANGGYAQGMNLAYRHSRGRLLLASNPDVLFTGGAVSRLVHAFDAQPGLGAVAPAVYGDPGLLVQMPIHILPSLRDLLGATLATLSVSANRRYSRRRLQAALAVWTRTDDVDEPMFGGCCFLTSREVIAQIGFFDAEYPLYFEDTDLSLRMRQAGLRIRRIAGARIVHLYDRSAATQRDEAMARHRASRRRFFAKWHGGSGRLAVAFTTWLLESRLGRALARRVAAQPTRALAFDADGLELRLPHACARFVVEIAFEPFLMLAAATFGSGDRWLPSDTIRRELRREAWFRVVDLTGRVPVELGRWHYPGPRPDRMAVPTREATP